MIDVMDIDPFISALQIGGLLSCLLCLIFVLFICANYWVLYKNIKTIEILTILSIIGFGIHGLSSAFYFMFDKCGLEVFHSSTYCDIWTFIWFISWRFAIVMMSVLYMKRLQFTFDHLARFKTPKKIYNLFYALNGIFVILSFMAATVHFLDENSDFYSDYFAVVTVLSQTLQFLISFGLIKLYIDKLFVLNEQAGLYLYTPPSAIGQEFDDYEDDDNDDSESAPELSLDTAAYHPQSAAAMRKDVAPKGTTLTKQISNNPAQKKILGALSKMTVLSALAIISSETMFTFQAIGTAAGWFTNNEIMLVIWYIGWDIDVVINAMSLFLSFDFNDDVYQKWCCGLHRCCMWTCDKCSRRKRVRNANDLEESLIAL